MANFVLVHGAWSGGQTYDSVAARLRAAGHEVLVPQLKGLGMRQGELSPSIILDDHVADVVLQASRAGFDRFVLAGHSYGGMVITGVSAILGRRIDALCYIDAFLPQDGQSLWDIAGPYEHAWYIDQQKDTPGLVPPIGQYDFEHVHGLRGRHPLLTLLQPVKMTGEEKRIPRRSYIFATAWEPTPFARFAQQVKDNPAWEYHELACSHFVMDDAPDETTEILMGLAG